MSKETMLAPDFSKQATRGFDTTYQKTSCGASCNICGSSRRKSVYSKRKDQDSEHSKTYTITKDITSQPYEIVECLECGLIYTLSQDSRASLLEEYSSMEDGLYLKEANGRRKAAKRVLDEISDFKKKGRLLEIGCACGFLLDEARQSGWEASGIEPSRWAAEYARDALGLDVTNGALEDSDIDKGAFDVIVAIDVLEHLSDPKSALKKMRESLKEDGLLYVAIPDISSAASRLFKSRWWGIKRHHLYYFTKETLRLLLEREGFEVVRKAYYLRYFTLGYITTLLDAHNSAFTRTIKHLLQWVSLTDKQVSLNLYDQTAIFSRKKRKLEDIINIEDAGRETIRAMKTTVVLPAYNAAKTLRRTLFDIPEGTADEIILVDDASRDNTVEIARDLELKVFTHDKNSGYGANQKTCYDEALKAGADIVVMLHPDYQYDPALIPELIAPIKKGEADAVFGSRMMKGGALEG
ncbi:MAG: methyltransferase domain-containing protein, partial [Candidatus Omnitrophica bacterium]|nr:methyltransferase domain-containing protein [Candidatus Omnitrophota bacterium]